MAIEDLYLDPATGDIALDADGNVKWVEGAARVRQQLEARLNMQKGSWFRDLRVGVDWIGKIFAVGATDTEIRAEIVRESLAVPGVARVASVAVVRDLSAKSATITVEAQTAEGFDVGVTVS